MPDISMCANEECPLKKGCYRYTATPNPYRQAYGSFKFNPARVKMDQDPHAICEHFWYNI